MSIVVPLEGFGGGPGLNFKVVGGTSQPTNPRENTIWINTSTTITDWVFSTTQPTSATGRVWILTDTFSNAEFNALKKNGIYVYPISAKQYVSGAWKDVTVKSYLNGAWVSWWQGELYDSGNLYESVTGGWTTDDTTSVPTITYNATNMTITATTAGTNRKVRTKKTIDTSRWSKLVFEGTHNNAQSYNTMGLLDSSKNEVASVQLINSHELDISSLNGWYYVFFQVRDPGRPTVVTKLNFR